MTINPSDILMEDCPAELPVPEPLFAEEMPSNERSPDCDSMDTDNDTSSASSDVGDRPVTANEPAKKEKKNPYEGEGTENMPQCDNLLSPLTPKKLHRFELDLDGSYWSAPISKRRKTKKQPDFRDW